MHLLFLDVDGSHGSSLFSRTGPDGRRARPGWGTADGAAPLGRCGGGHAGQGRAGRGLCPRGHGEHRLLLPSSTRAAQGRGGAWQGCCARFGEGRRRWGAGKTMQGEVERMVGERGDRPWKPLAGDEDEMENMLNGDGFM